MISDPGAGLETREARRSARLAVWIPWWRDATAVQKKDIVWAAFVDFYGSLSPESRARLQSRVRTAMGDPDATLREMGDWIYDNLATRQLLEVMTWLS